MNQKIVIFVLLLLSGVCGEPTATRTLCPTGEGSWNYCSPSSPCNFYEGDCDTNNDCISFAKCVKDIGDGYGFLPEVDVCLPFMHGDYVLGNQDFCKNEDCNYGEGSCKSDSECRQGLVCKTGIGLMFGYPTAINVCDAPEGEKPIDRNWFDVDMDFCYLAQDECHDYPLGTLNYCTESCLCSSNEGDCDGDDECQPGLYCVPDVGSYYGWSSTIDVCLGEDDFDLVVLDYDMDPETVVCNELSQMDLRLENKGTTTLTGIVAYLDAEESWVIMKDDDFGVVDFAPSSSKWVGDFDFVTDREGLMHFEVELRWNGGASIKELTIESTCPPSCIPTGDDNNCDTIDNDCDGLVDEGCVGCILADVDGNHNVGLADVMEIRRHWTENYPRCDLNKDGLVGLGDIMLILPFWAQNC